MQHAGITKSSTLLVLVAEIIYIISACSGDTFWIMETSHYVTTGNKPWAVSSDPHTVFYSCSLLDKRFRNNQPLSPGYPVGASGLDGYCRVSTYRFTDVVGFVLAYAITLSCYHTHDLSHAHAHIYIYTLHHIAMFHTLHFLPL